MNYLRQSYIVVAVLLSCSGRQAEFIPTHKPLCEAVYASGYVVSKNEYQVFSQVDGYVTAILVEEGDPLKKGQPIFVIDSRQQDARYNIALETYRQSKKNRDETSPALMEAKAAVTVARTKYSFDSVNFARYSNLFKSNAATRNDYDKARLGLEDSRNELILQESRLRKLRDQLNLDVTSSENNFRIAAEESGRYIVRSDMDGKLYRHLKEVGELVRKSEVLGIVGSAREFYLQLNVDAVDVQRLKTGQQVLVKIDAFGEKTFRASVQRVYPRVDTRDQTVRVDAYFDSPLEDGFTGLAVEANIIIQQKEEALVISKSLLLAGDSVLIRRGSDRQKVKITRGIETLDEVEVVAGISEKDILLKN